MKAKTDKEKKIKIVPTWVVVLVFFVVVISWLYSKWIMVHLFGISPDEKTFWGDAFIGISTLFAGLAFAGVLYTIKIQNDLIRDQKIDFNKQIEVANHQLQLAIKQQEIANDQLVISTDGQNLNRQQAFETTFFSMLNNQNDIVKTFIYNYLSVNQIKGRVCFKLYYETFLSTYKNNKHLKVEELSKGNKVFKSFEDQYVWHWYDILYNNNKANLNHYFQFFYHILKTIDSEYSKFDKVKYTDILRANLSAYEHIILFYYGIWKDDNGKFKSLITKYAFLENMDHSLILDVSHWDFYDLKAYGEDANKIGI